MSRSLPTVEGESLQEIDHYPDGGSKVPDPIVERAGMMGALRLLLEIAQRDDNPQFRQEAGRCAGELKRLVRRRGHQAGMDITDAELMGHLLPDLRAKRLAAEKTVREIVNGPDPLVIGNDA